MSEWREEQHVKRLAMKGEEYDREAGGGDRSATKGAFLFFLCLFLLLLK